MTFMAEVGAQRALREITPTRPLAVGEWVLPGTLVLALTGVLDQAACREVEQRIRRLLSTHPGLDLTLDLSGVERVEQMAAEGLFLSIVSLRAGESRLAFAAPSAVCQAVLNGLGIEAASGRPAPRSPWSHLLVGVTA